MKLYQELEYVQGHLKSGHLEYVVPKEEEEMIKSLSEEDLQEHMHDNAELILDDFNVDDYEVYGNVKIIE